MDAVSTPSAPRKQRHPAAHTDKLAYDGHLSSRYSDRDRHSTLDAVDSRTGRTPRDVEEGAQRATRVGRREAKARLELKEGRGQSSRDLGGVERQRVERQGRHSSESPSPLLGDGLNGAPTSQFKEWDMDWRLKEAIVLDVPSHLHSRFSSTAASSLPLSSSSSNYFTPLSSSSIASSTASRTPLSPTDSSIPPATPISKLIFQLQLDDDTSTLFSPFELERFLSPVSATFEESDRRRDLEDDEQLEAPMSLRAEYTIVDDSPAPDSVPRWDERPKKPTSTGVQLATASKPTRALPPIPLPESTGATAPRSPTLRHSSSFSPTTSGCGSDFSFLENARPPLVPESKASGYGTQSTERIERTDTRPVTNMKKSPSLVKGFKFPFTRSESSWHISLLHLIAFTDEVAPPGSSARNFLSTDPVASTSASPIASTSRIPSRPRRSSGSSITSASPSFPAAGGLQISTPIPSFPRKDSGASLSSFASSTFPTPNDYPRRHSLTPSASSYPPSPASIIFRGSRAFDTTTERGSPTQSNFSSAAQETPSRLQSVREDRANAMEKSKRLALFLDQAAALRGSESVEPWRHSFLSSSSSSNLSPPASPISPTSSTGTSRPPVPPRNRSRPAFTPSPPIDEDAIHFAETKRHFPIHKRFNSMDTLPSGVTSSFCREAIDSGVGLDSTSPDFPAPIPSTSLPLATTSDSDHELLQKETLAQMKRDLDAEAARKRLARQDRRRRTIAELIETELSYASDMAVARDIYMARARGAAMDEIADHVMSSGLGLGNLFGDQPPSPTFYSGATSPATPAVISPPKSRRVSSSSVLATGKPLMSATDMHVIFANLDDIADLAEVFAGVLDGARGDADDNENRADRIGEVFTELLPRIQRVYSSYCARHHRAIVRLQELEPSLRDYLAECKSLAHGRTNTWSLASILIKPVQRCLKYPLLLQAIIATTPEDHPDYAALEIAHKGTLKVAQHINEVKRRFDLVGRIINRKEAVPRAPSSAISRGLSKRFLRSSQKAKQMVGLVETIHDDQLDEFILLVENTRTRVHDLTIFFLEWSKDIRRSLEAQISLVEAWMELCAPMEGETVVVGGSYDRLAVFLEECLKPVIAGPWKILDHEIRNSLLVKTQHLLSLFERPRDVIRKRADKLLDHSRYLASHLPEDRRGSEECVLLSSQLVEELPRFLSSTTRYLQIIGAHYAAYQKSYYDTVALRWSTFSEHWISAPADSVEGLGTYFAASFTPVDEMMEQLSLGFNVPTIPSLRPLSTSDSGVSHETAPLSFLRGYRAESPRPSLSTASSERSSATSSSPSSIRHSVTSSYATSEEASTSSRLMEKRPRREGYVAPVYFQPPLPAVPDWSALEVTSNIDDATGSLELEQSGILYVAVTTSEVRSRGSRDGQAILSFGPGELLAVQLEEADRSEGGSGWLYGAMLADGRKGWCRTEDLELVSDERQR